MPLLLLFGPGSLSGLPPVAVSLWDAPVVFVYVDSHVS